MLTILTLLTTLAAAPWTDPFVPASEVQSVLPIERWASYWPTPAPVLKAKLFPDELADRPVPPAKPIPIELCDTDPPHAGRLSVTDFLGQWETNELQELTSALTVDLITAAATSQVISNRAGERVVLSALLCQAHQLLVSENTHTTRAGRAWLKAQQDRSQLQLDVLGIQPLACDTYPVTQLIDCLGLVPASKCTANSELAAQVRAAEKLETP